ncbi:MAG: hypothetical protein ACM3ML_23990 [Micromonosporaceae bacterium]
MRTAGRLLIVGSVVAAAGMGLLAAAGPAGAAAISAPNVITSPSTVTITAKTDAVQGAKLLFDGNVVASAGQLQLGSTLSYKFSTSSLRNGPYSAVLTEQLLVLPWHTAASATITLRIPPAPPSGVTARLVSGRTVRVSWARGAEPDLTSYDVVSTAGAATSGLGVGSACGSGTCSATLTVPGGAATSAGFAVVAHRHDGAGGTLASGASPTAYVNVPASGGSGVGGGQGAGRRAGGSGYGTVAAGQAGGYGSAYARLQGLSGESPALVLPTVGPQSGFALPISRTKTAESRHVKAWLAGVWYPAIAAILILLLIAAHFGAWTRRRRRARPPAPAPESGAASAASGGDRAVAADGSNCRRNGRHARELSRKLAYHLIKRRAENRAQTT